MICLQLYFNCNYCHFFYVHFVLFVQCIQFLFIDLCNFYLKAKNYDRKHEVFPENLAVVVALRDI